MLRNKHTTRKLHLVQYASFLSRSIKANAKENIFKESPRQDATGPSGPGPPYCRVLTITHTNTLTHTHTHTHTHNQTHHTR
jgi:hypothetical protein